MKLYHMLVKQEGKWLVGRVLEREGITTQGRSLDELLFMVRDAIELMWNEKGAELELFVPGKALTVFESAQNKYQQAIQESRRLRPSENSSCSLA